MLIDSAHPEETRVAILNGSQLEELDVETSARPQLKGNIYLAKVTRVEPSLQAAFVDYGGNRHGFLAFSEIHPDYYQIPVADKEQLLAEQIVEQENDNSEQDQEEPYSDESSDSTRPKKGVETIGGDGIDEVEARRLNKTFRRYKIQEVIKRRQILLIQVVKEERGNKGAALSTYLSLAGRYCVLMPNSGKGGGISRRIGNGNDRKRLKSIVSELDITDGMAVIVRTAGAERSKAEIKRDYEYLLKLWNDIRDLTMESAAPFLIHEETNIIKRALRDMYSRDMDEILVEGDEGYRAAKDLMKKLIPSHSKKVQPYKDSLVPIFSKYSVEGQLESMISENVKLKSGGYVVINSTEALVAIDVNSGRATRGRNIEETALRTNIEAAEEIARQLRLRDLAGLVVIDFIDMEINKNQIVVERKLKETMRRDRARIQIGRISPFGLLELSRQRLRPSISETTNVTCHHCGGLGSVRSIESSVLHILRGIEESTAKYRGGTVKIRVPGNTAIYLLNQKRDTLVEIEKKYELKLFLVDDDTLVPPNFEIEKLNNETELYSGDKQENVREKENLEKKPPPKKRRRQRSRSRNKEKSNNSSNNFENNKAKTSDKSQETDIVEEAQKPQRQNRRRKSRSKKDISKRQVDSSSLNKNNSEKNIENKTRSEKQKPSVQAKKPSSNVTKDKNNESNVTIVGSSENNELEQKNRTGWWQKLIE